MEEERMNRGSDEKEEDEDVPEEERPSQACAWCDKVHRSISKWMLPEDARDTYLERANCIPPPIFIISISIAELAVFIYYAVWMPQKQWITLDEGVWNSPFTYRPDKREEAWRFISYMLVHAGVQHILGNLFLQLLLGIPLELVHKGHRIGLVYLAGVIGGSLASSIFDPHLGLVGASGGVYALMGGYFMNVIVNFKEMVPLFGVFRLLFIVLIVGTDMGFALYRRFIAQTTGPAVSFVAHIAGGLAGMTIGYVVFSSFDKNLIKDPRFWICIAAYFVCVLFAIFFNIFLSPAS
ncbi:rhomboid-related protein 2 [Microcaecilia unicolor]|uniref:Rhomboid-related protein 2 n=1 Tax=Microcaecilia unicolor TaxID=1415580 RepID=A0A6P7Z6F9_9AMPH|nr:rhomboid-related protein 2 [Microcaecilia unicolor]XP_030074934.1 rhomboid-related protein 2 [Microcaecilia unicolor]